MAKNQNYKENSVEKELFDIKRLLMLLLIKAGASQKEIATAIKMDQGDLSRIIPARKFKKFNEPD